MYWSITLRRKQTIESSFRSPINLKTESVEVLKGMPKQKLFNNGYQGPFKHLAEIQWQNMKISGQS